MRLRLFILSMSVLFGLPAVASAGHEVDRSELRRAVADGSAVSFSNIQENVETRMGGTLVDVSLYKVGELYYRVLVRRSDGRLVSAVLDAKTGSFLPVTSTAAQSVQETARSTNAGSGLMGLFATPNARSSGQGRERANPGSPGSSPPSAGSSSGGSPSENSSSGNSQGGGSSGGNSQGGGSSGGSQANGGSSNASAGHGGDTSSSASGGRSSSNSENSAGGSVGGNARSSGESNNRGAGASDR